jgi:hypothetical protein
MAPAVTAPDLSPDERRRYDRHLILPEFGEAGQRRLRAGRVLIVRPGGFAPADPPTRSLAGTPHPRSARVAHSLTLVRFGLSV